MILALPFLATLAATAPFEETVDGWLVWQSDDTCVMSTMYEKGTTISLSQNWRTKDIAVRLGDEDWKSLGSRNGQEVRADFNLSGKYVEYDAWYSDSAVIVSVPAKNVYAVNATWDGEKYDKDFWPAWALADRVEVKIDGKLIGRFDLHGTYKASLALARCSAVALRKDTSDPFAE